MQCSGRKIDMKYRLMPFLLLMALLISLPGCTDADLVAAPGEIEVWYNILQPGREHLSVTVTGDWEENTPVSQTIEPSPDAETMFILTKILPMEDQNENRMKIGEVENLRHGLWNIEIEVTGTVSPGVDSTFCYQEIFRGQKTVITFTRGMSGCTCNKGCESPW